MKSQAGVYNINTLPEHHRCVQLCVTPPPTLDIATEEVFTTDIKFCEKLLKGAKNINNIF